MDRFSIFDSLADFFFEPSVDDSDVSVHQTDQIDKMEKGMAQSPKEEANRNKYNRELYFWMAIAFAMAVTTSVIMAREDLSANKKCSVIEKTIITCCSTSWLTWAFIGVFVCQSHKRENEEIEDLSWACSYLIMIIIYLCWSTITGIMAFLSRFGDEPDFYICEEEFEISSNFIYALIGIFGLIWFRWIIRLCIRVKNR